MYFCNIATKTTNNLVKTIIFFTSGMTHIDCDHDHDYHHGPHLHCHRHHDDHQDQDQDHHPHQRLGLCFER